MRRRQKQSGGGRKKDREEKTLKITSNRNERWSARPMPQILNIHYVI